MHSKLNTSLFLCEGQKEPFKVFDPPNLRNHFNSKQRTLLLIWYKNWKGIAWENCPKCQNTMKFHSCFLFKGGCVKLSGVKGDNYYFSSHHSFSFFTCSSSLGVKSFFILNVLRMSSGVLPLIIFATVLQVTSSKPWEKNSINLISVGPFHIDLLDKNTNLDVKIVSGQNEFEKCSLINLEKIGIPGGDVIGALLFVFIIFWWRRIILVVGGPLKNLKMNPLLFIKQISLDPKLYLLPKMKLRRRSYLNSH